MIVSNENAVRTAADLLMGVGCLVVQQAALRGYPDLLVVVPGYVPLFLWIEATPQGDEADEMTLAQVNIQKYGAAYMEVNDRIELAELGKQISAITGVGAEPDLQTERVLKELLKDDGDWLA